MTIQALRFLHFLKSVQMLEMNMIHLDFRRQEAMTLAAVSQKTVTKNFNKYYNSITPILDYLSVRGYVKIISTNSYHVVQVLHPAWHLKQYALKQCFKFIICSIIIPMLVAWLTAYLTAKSFPVSNSPLRM